MNFDLTDDQLAIEAALDQLVERYSELSVGEADYVRSNPALERDLLNGGYFDIVRQEGLGALEGVMLIEAVARIPYAVEVAGSALLAPVAGLDEVRRPVAVTTAPLGRPVRFLAEGGVLLVDTGSEVRIVTDAKVEPTPAFYAFPFGAPAQVDLDAAPRAAVDPGIFRQYWRLGLAAEIVGAMEAAVSATVRYVKERKQFGQPLGAFQAVQHRLSECAVLVRATRLLVREAAWSGSPAAAALAAAHAQEAAAKVVYDTHQFHGAIGLTLEYPLHYWTFRLRVLAGELGGATASADAAGELRWPEDQPIGDPFPL